MIVDSSKICCSCGTDMNIMLSNIVPKYYMEHMNIRLDGYVTNVARCITCISSYSRYIIEPFNEVLMLKYNVSEYKDIIKHIKDHSRFINEFRNKFIESKPLFLNWNISKTDLRILNDKEIIENVLIEYPHMEVSMICFQLNQFGLVSSYSTKDNMELLELNNIRYNLLDFKRILACKNILK